MQTQADQSLTCGTKVEVWQTGQPKWRGRIMVVRPGHPRPYVVLLDADIGPYPPDPKFSKVGEWLACYADRVHLPNTRV